MTAVALQARRSALDYAFWALAFCFGCGAVFHSIAAAVPTVDPEAPVWRHLLFVGINVACALGFLRRPLFFLPAFLVLVVQQMASHGSHAIHAWRTEGAPDLPSVGVVLVMPIAVTLLTVDQSRRRRRGSGAAMRRFALAGHLAGGFLSSFSSRSRGG